MNRPDDGRAGETRAVPINNGRTVGKDGKPYIEYVCPRCGNPVTRFYNKYHCGPCRQPLRWPGVDYSGEGKEGGA